MHEWKVDKADDSLKTQRSVSVFHILFCPTSYYLQFKLTIEFCKELESTRYGTKSATLRARCAIAITI